MKDWWLKIGCFLTGYNYQIVSRSSEITAKTVKRYTSAMLIVMILWAFIGYSFTERYLDGGIIGSIVGGLLFVIIIIQVERQIILAVHKNNWLYFFRGTLALIMALIGSLIIDQIIFKQDIELEKISFAREKAAEEFDSTKKEIEDKVVGLSELIQEKNEERVALIKEVSANPNTVFLESSQQNIPVQEEYIDSAGMARTRTVMRTMRTQTRKSRPNDGFGRLEVIQNEIQRSRDSLDRNQSSLITLRQSLQKKFESTDGFLDELRIMQRLVSKSGVAFVVWLLWILFLLGLELFILVSKRGEKSNDYDETIKHQMDFQLRRLALMSKVGERAS